jgi:hypothetical protein
MRNKTEQKMRDRIAGRKKPICHLVTITFYLGSLIFYVAGCEQNPPENREVVIDLGFQPAPRTPPDDAIEIGSAADLAKIGEEETGYSLEKSYKLTRSITVTGWMPLAQNNPFQGAFYGQGKTITIESGAGGLFHLMKEATVYDLAVDITATARGGYLGGIANYVERSWIEGCTAVVDLTLNGTGHNASAGGIVGFMRNGTTVKDCRAYGSVTLNSGLEDGLMVYAGGLAGYSGTALAGSSESYCRIEKSRWTGSDSTVTASGGYPYAGGVVGYNYTGAVVSRCWAEGAVTAYGGNLPYAGGVAGYNSRIGKKTGTPATIENSFATATVTAVSTSMVALGGGIAGANGAGALISKCYATGTVSVTVAGSGTSNIGGSVGVMTAANAGGIAGAQYVSDLGRAPTITSCAALNSGITGTDSAGSGAAWNICRIAGAGISDSDTGVFTNNIAWQDMSVTPARAVTPNANGKDGADCAAKPAQSAYSGWDFSGVWQMGEDGYPVQRWN